MNLYTLVVLFTALSGNSPASVKIENLNKKDCQQLITHYQSIRFVDTQDAICIRQEGK